MYIICLSVTCIVTEWSIYLWCSKQYEGKIPLVDGNIGYQGTSLLNQNFSGQNVSQVLILLADKSYLISSALFAVANA